ncbi:hypothetical protein ACFL27_09045 [candidate division CSSED10-310 bacterium]|uniref:DNA-binding protein n=1 Tax=candidate division CSSED10-310 bacterium TaxID=2855610 RepID=A0ABV6YVY7_UNCC1
MFEKISQKKDQILASFVSDILMSDSFAATMEKIIATGGFIDKNIQNTLNTFRVASKREIDDIEERLVRLERKMTRVVSSLEELKEKMETKSSRGAYQAISMAGVCESCGKNFTKKSFNQRFCSAACRSKNT